MTSDVITYVFFGAILIGASTYASIKMYGKILSSKKHKLAIIMVVFQVILILGLYISKGGGEQVVLTFSKLMKEMNTVLRKGTGWEQQNKDVVFLVYAHTKGLEGMEFCSERLVCFVDLKLKNNSSEIINH